MRGICAAMHILFTWCWASVGQISKILLQANNILAEIIKRVEHDVKMFKPLEVVLRLFNVAVYGCNLDIWIEGCSSLSGDLSVDQWYRLGGSQASGELPSHQAAQDRGWHTKALLCLTSFLRNKNCRLRFERSIVSNLSKVIFPKPVRTMFFTIPSHKRLLLFIISPTNPALTKFTANATRSNE
jgi:hypothetical protein